MIIETQSLSRLHSKTKNTSNDSSSSSSSERTTDSESKHESHINSDDSNDDIVDEALAQEQPDTPSSTEDEDETQESLTSKTTALETTLTTLQSQIQTLTTKITTIQTQLPELKTTADANFKEYNHQLLRLNAEYKSIKKRLTSTPPDTSGLIKTFLVLLDVIDNFDRALDSLSSSSMPEYTEFYKNLRMQYMELLRKHGLRELPGVGSVFDFKVHNAIMTEMSEEYDEGVVVKVFSGGFMYVKPGGKSRDNSNSNSGDEDEGGSSDVDVDGDSGGGGDKEEDKGVLVRPGIVCVSG